MLEEAQAGEIHLDLKRKASRLRDWNATQEQTVSQQRILEKKSISITRLKQP